MTESSPGADHRWMTYEALGEARGIDVESAARLARRRGWQRMPGNAAAVLIAVPVAEAELQGAPPRPDAPLIADLLAEVREGRAALDKAREALAVERVERAHAEGQATALHVQMAAMRRLHAGELAAMEAEVRAAQKRRNT